MQTSSKDFRKKLFGRSSEFAVRKYLKKHGYKILEVNYKTPFGEADIVAKSRDGYTCFVEVKARETDLYGLPAEAVTPEKQRRYRMIAKYWVNTLREEVPVRYDVAAVYGSGEIEYFENAYI